MIGRSAQSGMHTIAEKRLCAFGPVLPCCNAAERVALPPVFAMDDTVEQKSITLNFRVPALPDALQRLLKRLHVVWRPTRGSVQCTR